MEQETIETIKDSVAKRSKGEIESKTKKEFMNNQISTTSTSYNSNSNSNSTNIYDSKFSNSIIQNRVDENVLYKSMNIVPSNINSINNFIPNHHVQNNQLMLSKEYIINSFADQNATIYLQKQLRTISPKEIDDIIKILQGTFREIIKNKNGNYFCTDLFKGIISNIIRRLSK